MKLTDTQKQCIAVITQFLVAALALYNWVGVNCPQYNLPSIVIGTDTITSVVTAVVVIAVVAYNTWKNRNLTDASQLAQQVLDALKSGLLAPEAVSEMLDDAKQDMQDMMDETNKEIEKEILNDMNANPEQYIIELPEQCSISTDGTDNTDPKDTTL